MENNSYMYLVIIEWDGKRPPTTFYNRLRKFGMSIRGNGDKDESPLLRRTGQEEITYGVVMQEGSIICKSESTARTIGHLAMELGARSVAMGDTHLIPLGMTTQDENILDNIQNVLGKRGRPVVQSEQSNWVVTCLDEATSSDVTKKKPVHCTKCGSFLVQVREGNRVRLSLGTGNIFKIWFNSRFCSPTGNFEIPVIDEDFEPQKITIETVSMSERKYIESLASTDIYKKIDEVYKAGKIDLNRALRYLDCAFVTLKNESRENRLGKRLNAFQAWVLNGRNPQYLLNFENDNIDVLDIYHMESRSMWELDQ